MFVAAVTAECYSTPTQTYKSAHESKWTQQIRVPVYTKLPQFTLSSPPDLHNCLCSSFRDVSESGGEKKDRWFYKFCHQFVPVIKMGCNWPNCGQSCLPMVQKSEGYPFTRGLDDELRACCSASEQWLLSMIISRSPSQIPCLIKGKTMIT